MSCNCDSHVSRRAFLGGAAAAGLMATARPMWAAAPNFGPTPRGKIKACIMLFLNGGASQFETWSPAEGQKTGGPTKALATNVEGVSISENLPKLATRADRLTVLRAMTAHIPAHEPAREFMHTGHSPNATLAYPAVASVVCKEFADSRIDLPGFISINGAGHDEGFLEAEYAPFVVRNAMQPVENVDPGKAVTDKQLKDRRDLLEALEKNFQSERKAQELLQKRQDTYANAQKLMDTPLLKAFDVTQEPEKVRQPFGDHAFGQGCLMARRLVQAGVKFVEVVLGGWDTHQDNFNRAGELAHQLDDGFAALLDDLAAQKMLDETLIVCTTEFGRTPRINENDGRDHYAKAFSAAVAGGGVSTGFVLGDVDAEGNEVTDRPVEVGELTALMYERFGIEYTKTIYSPRGRPMKLSEKTPIKELI